MIIKITDYDLGEKIVSLAFNKKVDDDLKENGLETIYVDKNYIYFWKNDKRIEITSDIYEKFSYCDNYDVFQIDKNGNAYLFYNNELDDNVFMITGKCNSNCIMCPAGNHLRKNAKNADLNELLEIIKHIPTDSRHFTITGGEPFLVGKEIFPFLEALKHKFKYTDFLFLTNGRALCIPEYATRFNDSSPYNMLIGIPIHGHNEKLHDFITRSPGSFRQTLSGIENLLKLGRKVEIRIVVSLLNAKYIADIVDLIIEQFPTVNCVKIMGMEMTGNAAINREELWLSYKVAFEASKKGIDALIKNKIDVALYNFPLCSVERPYRMLCKKSITDYKIRYAEQCEACHVKSACGGMFVGSYLLAKEDVIPEVKND